MNSFSQFKFRRCNSTIGEIVFVNPQVNSKTMVLVVSRKQLNFAHLVKGDLIPILLNGSADIKVNVKRHKIIFLDPKTLKCHLNSYRINFKLYRTSIDNNCLP